MDLSFLDEIESVPTDSTVLIIVGVAICLISLVLYGIFGRQYIFWCIVFSLTSGTLGIYGIYVVIKNTETKFIKYEKLSDTIEETYGVRISDRDCIDIVEKYSDGSGIRKHKKAVVKKQGGTETTILYYSVDGSVLNFYKDTENNKFTRVQS